MSNIPHNLKVIEDRISKVKEQFQINNDICLLCVTKTKPIEDIIVAYNEGYRHFGESYINEAVDKIKTLKEMGYNDIIWHFIGPIQSNKTKAIAENFDIVESVDREKIIKHLNDKYPHENKLQILLQVNISHEEQKSGCSFDDIPKLVSLINEQEHLKLCGLMGVAKDTDNFDEIFSSFLRLKECFDKIKEDNKDLTILSMGMTHDLELAIKAGSNEVRIGSAIFGPRLYKNKD